MRSKIRSDSMTARADCLFSLTSINTKQHSPDNKNLLYLLHFAHNFSVYTNDYIKIQQIFYHITA